MPIYLHEDADTLVAWLGKPDKVINGRGVYAVDDRYAERYPDQTAQVLDGLFLEAVEHDAVLQRTYYRPRMYSFLRLTDEDREALGLTNG